MWIMIDRHLSDEGYAILATKRYYFGVGGGTAMFEEIIRKHMGKSSMSMELLRSFEDGHSNVRDILKVTKSKKF